MICLPTKHGTKRKLTRLADSDIRRYSICRPKIPIISYEWLKKCYDESKLVSMEEYRCGETGIGLLQMQRLNSNMSASVPHSELMRNPSESRLTSLHSTKRIKVVKQHDTNSLIDADLRLMRSPMPHFSSISCPPKDRVSEIQNKIVTHSQIPEMNSDAFLAGKCLTAAGFLPRQIEVIKLEVSKYKGTFTDRSDCDGHCPVYCIVPFDR